MESVKRPELKSLTRRLLLRAYFVVAPGWCVATVWAVDRAPGYLPVMVPLAIPFLLSLFILVGSLLNIPFRYGVLGAHKRMPFPNETPIVAAWGGGGSVFAGGLGGNFYVFPSGLGISGPFGKVFIPIERITGLAFTGGGALRIRHNSRELRGSFFYMSGLGMRGMFKALQTTRRQYAQRHGSQIRTIWEAVSDRHDVPVPKIRLIENRRVFATCAFDAPGPFPGEGKLRAVAQEAATLLEKRDPLFRGKEHLTIRFAHGEETRAWWRRGKLEMVREEPENREKEA